MKKISIAYFILGLILVLTLFYTNKKQTIKCLEKFKNKNTQAILNKYLKNSYVNSLPNHDISEKRLKYLIQNHISNGLPKPFLNKALHYHKDKYLIEQKYPNINAMSRSFKKRPGAYGLTASFIQFLEKNKNNDYAVWYEDDAIPNTNINFKKDLLKALNCLPKKGADTYFFAYTNAAIINKKFVTCSSSCTTHGKGWIKMEHPWGTHSILFSKLSIQKILNYMTNNVINKPIDDLIFELNNSNIINCWQWTGYKAGKDNMICGLFSQADTFCNMRPNNVI